MGCCASRPVDYDSQPNATPTSPRRTTQHQHQHQQHPTTSETAINPTASTARRRTSLLEPQTSRQSSESSPSHRISLSEHYNLPLQTPKPWQSKSRKWTPASLRRERYEFFETRVTGHREIWAALRQVAECVRENDLETAQGILDAVGVTLPTGRLEEGGYDEAGNLYRLPAAVLSDPGNLQPDPSDEEGGGERDAETDTLEAAESKEVGAKVLDDEADVDNDVLPASPARVDKGKQPVERDAVKVKCRLSDRGGPDVVVAVGRTSAVAALVRRVRDEGEISIQARVRVAYLGRILDEKKSLMDQGWKEGHVVNVLITGVYAA